MNVASRELSEELWELSGWIEYRKLGTSEFVPKYTLGYLLRKLPHHIEKLGHYESLSLDSIGNQWNCRYGIMSPAKLEASAKTPEDAACKLAISLIKSGLLKKES